MFFCTVTSSMEFGTKAGWKVIELDRFHDDRVKGELSNLLYSAVLYIDYTELFRESGTQSSKPVVLSWNIWETATRL